MDGLADAGVSAGRAAVQQSGRLFTAVKLKKLKLYTGQMEDPAVLDVFGFMCKLYFQLAYVTLNT